MEELKLDRAQMLLAEFDMLKGKTHEAQERLSRLRPPLSPQNQRNFEWLMGRLKPIRESQSPNPDDLQKSINIQNSSSLILKASKTPPQGLSPRELLDRFLKSSPSSFDCHRAFETFRSHPSLWPDLIAQLLPLSLRLQEQPTITAKVWIKSTPEIHLEEVMKQLRAHLKVHPDWELERHLRGSAE